MKELLSVMLSIQRSIDALRYSLLSIPALLMLLLATAFALSGCREGEPPVPEIEAPALVEPVEEAAPPPVEPAPEPQRVEEIPVPPEEVEALVAAVAREDVEEISSILNRYDIGEYPQVRSRALMNALLGNASMETIRALFDGGFSPNDSVAMGPQHSTTAMHMAAALQRPAILRELLDRGGDPNLLDNSGTTPLVAAAVMGDMESLRLLIEAGADVNAHGILLPGLCSRILDNEEVYEFLLQHGWTGHEDCREQES